MEITKVQSHLANKFVPVFRKVNVELLIYLKTLNSSVLQERKGRDHIYRVSSYDNHLVCFKGFSTRKIRRAMRFGDPNSIRITAYTCTKQP